MCKKSIKNHSINNLIKRLLHPQIAASVISSVGTVNYQESTERRPPHQMSDPRSAIDTLVPPSSSSSLAVASSTVSSRSVEPLQLMVLTTPTPANSAESGHSGSQASNECGGATNTTSATSSSCQQPRLHPKKRKFIPAEMEELEQPTSSSSNGGSNGVQTIVTSVGEHKVAVYEQSTAADDAQHVHQHAQEMDQQQQQIHQPQPPQVSVVITEENGSHSVGGGGGVGYYDGRSAPTDLAYHQQQQQPAVDGPHKVYNYSKYNRSNSGGKEAAPASYVMAQPPVPPNVDESLDLNEFVESRVLAKHQDVYVTGVIRSVGTANAIFVELDHPEGCRQVYYNILGKGRDDVVSDASPSANDVSHAYFSYV